MGIEIMSAIKNENKQNFCTWKSLHNPFYRIVFVFILTVYSLGCSSSIPTIQLKKREEYNDLMSQAHAFTLRGEFSHAVKFYSEACRQFILIDDMDGAVECCLNKALVYVRMGQEKNAMAEFARAKTIAMDLQLELGQAKVETQLALYWLKQGEEKKARESLVIADNILKKYKTEKELLLKVYAYLGYLELQKKKYAQAKDYFEKSLKAENSITKSYSYYNLARLAQAQAERKEAVKFAKQALNIDRRENYNHYIVLDYLLLAELYLVQKKITEAQATVKRALLLAKEMGDNNSIKKCEILLQKIIEENKTN